MFNILNLDKELVKEVKFTVVIVFCCLLSVGIIHKASPSVHRSLFLSKMDNTTLSEGYSCSSLWPLGMPKAHLFVWASLLAVLSPVTIVSNLALIYALQKTKQLASITNKLVCIMSISDLCTGLFVLPGITAMIALKDKLRNCTFELTMQYMAFVLAYFSFFILMSVSLDRYLHVTKPYRYKQLVNEFRMKVLVAAAFLVSCTVAAISITYPSFVIQVILNVTDISCVILVFILYVFVFKKISKHKENIRKFMRENGAKKAKRAACREISATKTIRLLLITLFALYLPYNFSSAAWAYYKFKLVTEPGLGLDVVEYISYAIVFANASANAIIFGLGNTNTRRFLKQLVGYSLKSQQSTLSTDGIGSDATSETSTAGKYNV